MPGSRFLIASNTLGSSAASVTFSGIPATYTDLVLKVSIRSNVANSFGILNFRINSNSSAIYSDTYIEGDGSGASSSRGSGNAEQYLRGMSADANQTSNTFASHEFYFPNYTSSANKVTSFFGANENNTTASRIMARFTSSSRMACISSRRRRSTSLI